MAFLRDVRRALHDQGFHLRVGVHTGRMEHVGEELGGPASTGALSLVELAGRHEVVLSRATVEFLPRHAFETQSRGSAHVESAGERWELYSLG
jgi:class 3 adenylate cyclase